MAKFTHLHVHSHYSLLDGLPKIDELISRTKELGMESVAITDHGALYGVIEFYKKAKQAGIKPIIGVETYVTPGNMHDKKPNVDTVRYHLILLAKNNTGYKNLIKLITLSHLEGFYYKPRVDKETLRKYSEGLIGLSSCLQGEISRALLGNNAEHAEKIALEYQDIFGKGNFFLELQHHPNIPEQEKLNALLKKLAQKLNFPLVATGDLHYLKLEDAKAQDVLMLVNTGADPNNPERLSLQGEDFSMKTPEEMAEYFKDTPEAIENTQVIANMCNVEIELGKVKLPYFKVPSGKTPDEYLKELCHKGIEKRYPKERDKPEILDRLNYELDVITKTGFASYFLIVQDFVNWAKNNGIVVGPGRGSAAGSIVSYLLNITNIDPLKYNLLFERFLNPERISMPDIDLDFTDTRRNEVIAYVSQKYGQDNVAQIITFGTMAARAALRDVTRALGHPYALGDRIAKMIPFQFNLKQAIDSIPEFRQAYDTEPDVREIVTHAMKLEGVARHASTHACGVVITKDQMDLIVPRQHASQDDQTIITQYEMHAVEDLGLLKMDFLGLKNLTIIENALLIIEKLRGTKLNLDEIPLNDKKAFEILKNADTTGVFQLECLTGDTIVSNTTLEKLFHSRNKQSLRSVYLDAGTLHNNPIRAILKSGKKKIYRVVTENGRIIKASAEHQFMTKDGWKKLRDLEATKDMLMYKPNAKHMLIHRCISCGLEREILSENTRKQHGFCYTCSAKHFRNPSKPYSRKAMAKARNEFYAAGGKPWNNGLTINTSPKLRETGRKIAQTLTGVTLEMRCGPTRAAEIKRRASEQFRGSRNPMFGKKAPHRKGGFREDLGHYVRSNWEADFARILKLHSIEYKYEPHTFTLTRKNGEQLSYTPDFFTPATNTYYEIKGWLHELDAEKMRLFQEQYSQYNFVLINTTRFAELAMKYNRLIKWECPVVPNQLSFTRVIDIQELEEKTTYDIVMEAPGNNFIANGFVVHNSGGMRRYLKELVPTTIEDIIAMVALFRPGPMELIPDYIGRKHGYQPIQYLHPKLEPILKNTYGIPVYQEQILQIARDLAGYTLGEADVLRKAIGKKIKELMHSERAKFIEKAMKNGVTQTVAEKIFNFIEPFAGYSFNRSHAACYALIGYQTAYLKANYPIEFMTALMNAEQGDIERIAVLIQECKQMGIEVLAPDINESKKNFTVIPDKNPSSAPPFVKTSEDRQGYGGRGQIRFGLLAIKNVGENIVETIGEERKTNGPFLSIGNFAERIQSRDLNKKSMESLIKAGAFDAFGERSELLHNLERILYANREIAKTKSAGQTGLFGAMISPASFKLEPATPATKHEKLMWEKELLGLYISSHPLEDVQGKLRGNVTEIKTISHNQAGQIVRVGAVISTIKKIVTKAGQPMLFCTIEDLSGRIETLVFPSTLQKFPTSFQENGIIVLKARVTDKDGTVKLICEDVRQIA